MLELKVSHEKEKKRKEKKRKEKKRKEKKKKKKKRERRNSYVSSLVRILKRKCVSGGLILN